MKSDEAAGADRARDLEELAGNLGMFGTMSGTTRRKIAAALGEAAALERERSAIRRDRAAIEQTLVQYHDALAASNYEMKRFTAALEKDLGRTEATSRETLASNEAAAGRQVQARELLDRLAVALETTVRREQEAGRLQQEVARQQSAVEDQAKRLGVLMNELAQRARDVAQGEGQLAAGKDEVERRRVAADLAAERQRREQERLDLVHAELEKDRRQAIELQESLRKLIEDAHAHERAMDGHQARLEARLAQQDQREAGQDERQLAQDRERLDIDARIGRLADLDDRDKRLMEIQAHQEEERIRLNADFSAVQRNQKLTIDTWDKLKETLNSLEKLETRVQDTNDVIQTLRDETEARARALEEAWNKRATVLDKRAREIDSWRMNAENRERKVQDRYNELDELERRKIEAERRTKDEDQQRLSRKAEWEKELQRQQSVWAERRAEAEKARELYERNVEVVEKRLDALLEREEEHQRREGEIVRQEAQLKDRERLLAAREEQINQLMRQRDSLNAVIASLATQIGRDWTAPDSVHGSNLEPREIDGGSQPEPAAGSSAAGIGPGRLGRPGSSWSSSPPSGAPGSSGAGVSESGSGVGVGAGRGDSKAGRRAGT